MGAGEPPYVYIRMIGAVEVALCVGLYYPASVHERRPMMMVTAYGRASAIVWAGLLGVVHGAPAAVVLGTLPDVIAAWHTYCADTRDRAHGHGSPPPRESGALPAGTTASHALRAMVLLSGVVEAASGFFWMLLAPGDATRRSWGMATMIVGAYQVAIGARWGEQAMRDMADGVALYHLVFPGIVGYLGVDEGHKHKFELLLHSCIGLALHSVLWLGAARPSKVGGAEVAAAAGAKKRA
eukprot:g584.t1